uniref:Putative secreted protein n=1 Tax=Rhipicephalus microplus TaxID=6941 RepID=A0A6M2DDB4_RHIMP
MQNRSSAVFVFTMLCNYFFLLQVYCQPCGKPGQVHLSNMLYSGVTAFRSSPALGSYKRKRVFPKAMPKVQVTPKSGRLRMHP